MSQQIDVMREIILARNFQTPVGYADLMANHNVQVQIARKMREIGYYYERKKKGWKNLDEDMRGLFPLAMQHPWARIQKERLSQLVMAIIGDPQTSYLGADYIFREKYADVFNEEKFNTDYYIVLHLLFKRYVDKVARREGIHHPRYHVLSLLFKNVRIPKNKMRHARTLLEGKEDKSLLKTTQILFDASTMLVKKLEDETNTELSYNEVFAKKQGMIRRLKGVIESPSFSKRRKKFLEGIKRFRKRIQSFREVE